MMLELSFIVLSWSFAEPDSAVLILQKRYHDLADNVPVCAYLTNAHTPRNLLHPVT
jgi:hypothetical protein